MGRGGGRVWGGEGIEGEGREGGEVEETVNKSVKSMAIAVGIVGVAETEQGKI